MANVSDEASNDTVLFIQTMRQEEGDLVPPIVPVVAQCLCSNSSSNMDDGDDDSSVDDEEDDYAEYDDQCLRETSSSIDVHSNVVIVQDGGRHCEGQEQSCQLSLIEVASQCNNSLSSYLLSDQPCHERHSTLAPSSLDAIKGPVSERERERE